MKLTGTATLQAPVDRVWAAFNDPAVLARCLPGCESLTETGPDAYAMRVTAGVAAIKGTYEGRVSLADKHEPRAFTMRAEGAGGPGTVAADVRIGLTPSATGGTDLSYDADAVVGGTIGGVGQRMLTGVTRKMAGEFFQAIDDDIAGGNDTEVAYPGVYVDEAPTQPRPIDGVGTSLGQPTTTPATHQGRAAHAGAPRGPLGDKGFALGVAVGGVVALLGVALGAAVRGGR